MTCCCLWCCCCLLHCFYCCFLATGAKKHNTEWLLLFSLGLKPLHFHILRGTESRMIKQCECRSSRLHRFIWLSNICTLLPSAILKAVVIFVFTVHKHGRNLCYVFINLCIECDRKILCMWRPGLYKLYMFTAFSETVNDKKSKDTEQLINSKANQTNEK